MVSHKVCPKAVDRSIWSITASRTSNKAKKKKEKKHWRKLPISAVCKPHSDWKIRYHREKTNWVKGQKDCPWACCLFSPWPHPTYIITNVLRLLKLAKKKKWAMEQLRRRIERLDLTDWAEKYSRKMVPGHERLCGCNTEHYPSHWSFLLWFRAVELLLTTSTTFCFLSVN